MKKRIAAFLLCILLLTGGASASAGRSDDPIISLSYLTDIFLPAVRASLASIADSFVSDYRARPSAAQTEPAVKSLTLKAGESLKLSEGEYFIMTSGTATLSVTSGTAVNATKGWETSGGAVRVGNRYIFCENAEAYLDIDTDAGVTVSYGAERVLGCPFTDVKRGDWFFSDVAEAYARGLVNGMTATTYSPKGTLTAGQCVKLAACMHQLYHTGQVTLRSSTEGKWFRSYVDYALENGILEQEFSDYDAVISRLQFIHLFYRALPLSEYQAVNTVEDNAIPDVAVTDPFADEIYCFYRAGILTGYEGGVLAKERKVTRDEVATIMNRMFDTAARRSFTLLCGG